LHEVTDQAVRDLAHRILERPEFADVMRAERTQRWMQIVIDWVRQFATLRLRSPFVYWLIIAGALAIAAALIVNIVQSLTAALRAPEPAERPAGAKPAPPDLAAQAEALASSGRYLEAAHSLMIACFRAMAERSLLELRPDRSNRWIRAALYRSSLGAGLAAEFDRLIVATEQRWFGGRHNDPEIYLKWKSAFARLATAEK
jgi:hypothetical protein